MALRMMTRGALASVVGILAATTLLFGVAAAQTPATGSVAKAPAAKTATTVTTNNVKGKATPKVASKRPAKKTTSKARATAAAAKNSPKLSVKSIPAMQPRRTATPPPANTPAAVPATMPATSSGTPPGTPPGGGASTPPPDRRSTFGGESPRGTTMSMDFRGVDINNVLRIFATTTGWQIVPDATLTGPVTIISPQQLSVDQAFEVLQSTLSVRGFTGQFEKHGETTILKIVPLSAALAISPLMGSTDPLDGQRNQVVTQVIPLQNADAATMARDLTAMVRSAKGASIVGNGATNSLVVTDTANNVARIGQLVKVLDSAGSLSKIQIFALKHSDATEMASIISNIYKQAGNRTQASQQNPQQPNMPGMPPGMQPQGQSGRSSQGSAVIAVADTRSNSVLVVASEENLGRVKELIDKLDTSDAAAMTTKIIPVKYADAVEVADLVNSILSGSIPSKQGSGSSFMERVFGISSSSNTRSQSVTSNDPFAKVVADTRTNSLLVTATTEKMARIEDWVTKLDVKVPVETTTFVIPLKKAQALDLADVLNNAFGSSTSGYNPYGTSTTSRNSTRSSSRTNSSTSTSTSRTNSSRRGGGATRSAARATAPVADSVHGTMTETGFVPDPDAQDDQNADGSDGTRQFYYGYGSSRTNSTTPTYGRSSTGQYANLLQLRSNVGVVADTGTNSLIITATPDNYQAVLKIIEQLDQTPRQVMIEVIIAEASLDATQKLGVQFDANGIGKILGDAFTQTGSSNFSLSGGNTTSSSITAGVAPGFQYGIQAVSGKFNALLQALSTDTRVRILSTPKVFTSNNQNATISITTNVAYVTSSYTSTTTGSSSNYDFLNLGISLDVTPQITADGHVTIAVVADDSELLGFDTITSSISTDGTPTTIQAPRTSERKTDTSVTVNDGDVVVLGGLMQNNKTVSTNKVPILGDLPFIGALFRSTNTNTKKTELMIFMVPHVVDSDKSIRALAQDQATALKTSIPELQRDHPMLAPDKQVGIEPSPAGAQPGYNKQ